MPIQPVTDETPKAQNFFAGQKRKLKLDKWLPKHNNEGEKRALIQFGMPLTGQPAVGHPEFIKATFATMEQEKSAEQLVKLFGSVENCTIEFYDLEENPDAIFTVNGATLDGFEMEKVPEGEISITVLRFDSTVPRNLKLLEFLHKYERKELWAMFTPTQEAIEGGSGSKQMRLQTAKAS
jgi:hypothetical protein